MKGIKIFWKKTFIITLHTIFQVDFISRTTLRKRLDSKPNGILENLISVKPKLWVLNIGVTGVKFLPVCWYENANFFSGIHLKKINSNNKFCNFYDNFWHQSIQIFGTWIQKTCITNRFISFALPNIDLFLHDSKPARLFTSMTKFCTFPLNWGS